MKENQENIEKVSERERDRKKVSERERDRERVREKGIERKKVRNRKKESQKDQFVRCAHLLQYFFFTFCPDSLPFSLSVSYSLSLFEFDVFMRRTS